jgi:imidazolonepropionase-like amidohydrolase
VKNGHSGWFTASAQCLKTNVGILVVLTVITEAAAQARPEQREAPVALTHVTVIDGSGRPADPDMTVIIKGDRIATVGRSGAVKIPRDARVVDARGKWLIPGLWDMHVHVDGNERALPLFVANGVTAVRDMGGSAENFELLKKWRTEIEARTRLGPHVFSAGVILDGSPPIRPWYLAAADVSQGRKAVVSLKQRGADFVKVYERLDRDTYYAIADEARRRRLPFVGHVPGSVTAAEASDAGQKSVEHLVRVLLACSSAESELRPKLNGPPFTLVVNARELLGSYDPARAQTLFARFVRNETWHCPTLGSLRPYAEEDASYLINDPRVRFLTLEDREGLKHALAIFKRDFGAAPSTIEDIANGKAIFEKHVELVGTMHRAGVRLLAGTDGLFPGSDLHDELGLLVRAGLTPAEALQAATRNAAEFFGLAASRGTIGRGKTADLVLLDSNPLEDIANTRKIAAVVLGGRLLESGRLQEMLAGAEAGAVVK